MDDEASREHVLTLLKLWAIRCLDNIAFIDRELPMLQEMERRRGSGGGRDSEASGAAAAGSSADKPAQKKPWKPIVITREMLQVSVGIFKGLFSCTFPPPLLPPENGLVPPENGLFTPENGLFTLKMVLFPLKMAFSP